MSVSAEPLPDRAPPKTSPGHLLDTLAAVIAEAKARPLTVGEVVGKLQGKGLSLVCLVLALPFLQPLWLGPLSVFGGATDARALEWCDLMCMRAGGNDVEREREREREREMSETLSC